jgi:AcrR family transcriptional regulator
MPKMPRQPDEIESIKNQIVDHALSIIAAEGYENLSMRKLADRIGVSAKTLYNYFESKDEIYLHLINLGFTVLKNHMLNAIQGVEDPVDKARAICKAYLAFGLKNPHYYNIMYSMSLPKHDTFKGTPLEKLADIPFNKSERLRELAVGIIYDVLKIKGDFPKEAAEIKMLHIWAALHGLASIYVFGTSFLDWLKTDEKALDAFVEECIRSLQCDYCTNCLSDQSSEH